MVGKNRRQFHATALVSTPKPPSVDPLDELVKSLGPAARSAARLLRLLEVADEETRRATKPTIPFALLAPPSTMVDVHEDVYRAHCRELLQRRSGFDVATDAEVLVALSWTSLRAPFNERGLAAIAHVADRVFTTAEARSVANALGSTAREPWQGATRELLDEVRKRIQTGRPHAAPKPPAHTDSTKD